MNKLYFLLIIVFAIFGCTPQPTATDPGKEIVLRLEPKPGNPRNSEGDFVQLKDGRILFVYTHFTGGTSDHALAHLAGRFSSDGGKTWTMEDVTILPNEGNMNVMSVSLLRLKDGNLALFYLRKNSETDCIPFLRTSSDEAQSWSEPIRCIETDGYHVVNNDRLVQLPGGRLIFPTSLHNKDQSGMVAKGEIMCYYSDNNGTNWKKSQLARNPENIVLQEPGLVELKSGELMLFCRTASGVQYFSYSQDQGKTWSSVEPGNIKSPLSPASIEPIPSTGDLLLAWNNNYEAVRDGGKRTPYNLAISKNEGKSWDKIKAIESDPSGWYCYTAVEFIGDHVLLAHCAGDTKVQSGLATTQITRLSLDWVYRDATGDPFIESEIHGKASLASIDENAKIYYTLNGTMPTPETGEIYEKPIAVTSPKTLNMMAISPGKTPSQIVTVQIGSSIYQPAQTLSAKLEQGLGYHYYESEVNRTDEIEDSQVVDSGVMHQFSLEKSKREINFCLTIEGYIEIQKEGLYTFYLESNDGSVLFLNNKKLIDNDGPHGAYEQDASTSLRTGMHIISVKYFQLGGGRLLHVSWKGPGLSKQEIPVEALFHDPLF